MQNMDNIPFNNNYRMVVKAGSNVLYGEETGIDINTMRNIVGQVAFIKQDTKRKAFMISSWAVAAWRKALEWMGETFGDTLSQQEQSKCASIWQPILFNTYASLFKDEFWMTAWQVLLNHRDLLDPKNRKNILDLLNSYGPNQIPIINANDANSHEELSGTKFSDNDELASLVAQSMKAQVLFILSNVKGFHKYYGKSNETLVERVEYHEMKDLAKHISKGKSRHGTWGMTTKIVAMKKVMEYWGSGIIADGKEPDMIQKYFTQEWIGTLFRWREQEK